MTKQVKILLLAAVGVVAIGAILFFNQPSGNTQTKGTVAENNVLQADKEMYDFGTISMKNGKVKTIFEITNPTTEILTLNKLYTTCMCTEARLSVNGASEGPFGMPGHGFIPSFEQRLEPNQTGEVEVIYDPSAHGPAGVGQIEREIILEGQGKQLAILHIKANVTP
ncbi:MAG: hypothetical protein A2722_04095 [Candidatus Doudnabacteria bacterium RIFCSPHIGHO2_01_FULL_50_11]|uniref:DUF1573 domain-containing protein n=1 Tax=Candidatus Doudnabacteria bacterium RIFCSPHIGHO2_01_FULL_50_11 TaxID=1817828 RepID=A0A1F5PFD3_9BACT|nr:MAG: hypothetical protein A2722_04095 [Candidatus Doudnabacteria bacterium RIFCSPHIGHO2_01_FULL_50_11]HLC45149.1 DUF1573 domain-containing protein [Patescibacteria group bacterium]